jgi:hypothetical protein
VTATNGRTTPVSWSFYSNTRVRPDGWAYIRLAPDGIQRVETPWDGSATYPHRVERELEMHGPYQTLEPGQTMSFEETWEILDHAGPDEPGAHLDFLDRLAALARTRQP